LAALKGRPAKELLHAECLRPRLVGRARLRSNVSSLLLCWIAWRWSRGRAGAPQRSL